ncbi:hypothetical protein SOVF_184660 [Spinacia oleracea]|nr:hypothetical protein SOVF_184660 [Spinacia oleracea]
MSVRDVVSWNLLISGYKRYGLPGKAFELYSEMLSQGFAESPSTFSCVMSICSNNGFYFEGIQVHSRVISLGFCGNLYIGSSIVDLYVQMGFVDDGLKVLNEMPERNVAVWNLVFRGFCKLGMWDEIIRCFPRVKFDGVMLNGLMVCYLLQGCCNGNFVIQGEQLHCLALKAGLVESDRFVANALVDFYSACGTLSDASKSFEIIPYDAVISWNSIVSAYANSGVLSDALEHFVRMHYWSMKPSVRSFVALLNSCSKSENLFLGTQLHCFVLKLGFDCGSIHVQSALIDMYGKCYEIESSFNIYEECTCKTMECCNALLTSMLHCSYAEEVVELFKFMGYEGIRFDEFSLSTTLKALSGSSYMSLSSCTLLHSLAIKIGFESHNVVSCSLIDTYSKLGQVDHSRGVFEGLCSPNVVSFTSIVNGYACNGLGKECLKLLEVMFQKGLKPDRVTFLCVLTGCNHSGLVEEGRRVFESMKSLHGIEPDPRHYSCMVDLLGRAGLRHLDSKAIRQGDWSQFYRLNCEYGVHDKIAMLGELESFDTYEEDEVEDFEMPSWTSTNSAHVLVNVDSFGAAGDGTSDDTQAFLSAWKQACSMQKSVLLVPEGRRYLVNATRFEGPCAGRLVVQIDGTVVAPGEPNDWDPKFSRSWLNFHNLTSVLFQGKGVIDGSGSKWWAASCKKNKTNPCKGAPTALTIESSSSIRVKGLTIQNSQQMHFVISHCDSVRVSNVLVSSPEDSPNTDGIHITGSTNVALLDCKIGTGDDCVSIVNASSSIKMKKIYCGPGHGISIGSLGKDNSTGIVTKVVLSGAFIRGASNGLRIKTWQGGSGYVKAVRFENVMMEDVANPIIIDQFYCDSPNACGNQVTSWCPFFSLLLH